MWIRLDSYFYYIMVVAVRSANLASLLARGGSIDCFIMATFNHVYYYTNEYRTVFPPRGIFSPHIYSKYVRTAVTSSSRNISVYFTGGMIQK